MRLLIAAAGYCEPRRQPTHAAATRAVAGALGLWALGDMGTGHRPAESYTPYPAKSGTIIEMREM